MFAANISLIQKNMRSFSTRVKLRLLSPDLSHTSHSILGQSEEREQDRGRGEECVYAWVWRPGATLSANATLPPWGYSASLLSLFYSVFLLSQKQANQPPGVWWGSGKEKLEIGGVECHRKMFVTQNSELA